MPAAFTPEVKFLFADDIATEIIELGVRLKLKGPSKRAKAFSGAHAQSAKSLAHDTLFSKILDAPAGSVIGRPADMREQLLSGEQADILCSDLTDDLNRLLRTQMLEEGKHKIKYNRGARSAKRVGYIRRNGPVRIYNRSLLLTMIDSILEDKVCVRQMTERIVSSGALYNVVRYCAVTAQLQIQKAPDAFRAGHLSFFASRGWDKNQVDEWILKCEASRLDRNGINKRAENYAQHQVSLAYERPPCWLFRLAGVTYVTRRILRERGKISPL
jgi:hypothetical protein